MRKTKEKAGVGKGARVAENGLPVVHRRAAGIDVGATFHVVAVGAESDPEPVRSFQSFTGDLHRLADWLVALGVTTVAMESTGVYWIPVFEILEARGLEVLLVNASHVKNVPGRKSDFNDAQWIQRLHEHGLLRGSFRPSDEVAVLRAYVRHRARLVELAASSVQHMQKALMQMNVQLHHVVSDITGATGMKIVRAIVAGERDPAVLAASRNERCKSSEEEICAALTGNYRSEHVFALQQALELYDVYLAKTRACDAKIEEALQALHRPIRLPAGDPEAKQAPEQALVGRKEAKRGRRKHQAPRKNKHDPAFDIARVVATLLGVDLTQIHGFGPNVVLLLIAECGTDMSRWATVKHFTSWLTLAPGCKISGGKVLSSKTRRSANRAAHALRMAAVSVGKTSTALGAFYRRLGARVGKAKAVIATARKLAVLFYNTLRYGVSYVDPGASAYEERYRQRSVDNLRRRARGLGFELVTAPSPEGVS
ncbi:IS110 family transposase [Nannocystis pusilla]|uniref:IS110 family transposase n=1 Tax=Nannocystis pusilla TaxID=889268 RepID=UPI003BF34DF7